MAQDFVVVTTYFGSSFRPVSGIVTDPAAGTFSWLDQVEPAERAGRRIGDDARNRPEGRPEIGGDDHEVLTMTRSLPSVRDTQEFSTLNGRPFVVAGCTAVRGLLRGTRLIDHVRHRGVRRNGRRRFGRRAP